MWSPFMDPWFHLIHVARPALRGFAHELVHFATRERSKETVLWVDGDHGFNSYDAAELNFLAGLEADDRAGRVLIKRCMTAFNWELALDKHIEAKMETTDVSAVVLAPYDALFCHPELADWEQEDYVRYSLRHLRGVARERQVPMWAFVDMDRLWRTHPVLAQMMFEQAQAHWAIDRPDGRWRAVEQVSGQVIDPFLRRQVTLLDFLREEAPIPVVSPRPRKQPHALPF